MGKPSKFFKSLLGFKTTAPPPSPSDPDKQPKRRWSFVKSHHSKSFDDTPPHHSSVSMGGGEDPNNHAVALAAAAATVVDAAVAAAQAAEVVVRLTSRTTGYGVLDGLAAVKIQSCFRAYLARRALKALKALVKLQALVRGHILRKQTIYMMRRLQTLVRVQARARAKRSQIHDSTHSTTKAHHYVSPTLDTFQHFVPPMATKHHHPSIPRSNGSKSYTRGIASQERMSLYGPTDDKDAKIVLVDTGKPHVRARRRNLSQPDDISFSYTQSLITSKASTVQPTSSSPCASCEVNSVKGSMRGGPSTPIKSDDSRSCICGYSDNPHYMTYTESSRAKVRSLSAPRLRSQFEIPNATKRDLDYKYMSCMQHVSTMQDSCASRVYPGSGRLDRLRMLVNGVEEIEFCGGYWN